MASWGLEALGPGSGGLGAHAAAGAAYKAQASLSVRNREGSEEVCGL